MAKRRAIKKRAPKRVKCINCGRVMKVARTVCVRCLCPTCSHVPAICRCHQQRADTTDLRVDGTAGPVWYAKHDVPKEEKRLDTGRRINPR